MEKEYFKKILNLGGGNDQIIPYDQFHLLIPEEEDESLGFSESYEGLTEDGLEGDLSPSPLSLGEEAEEDLDDGLEAQEIPEHEGLVAAYFRDRKSVV